MRDYIAKRFLFFVPTLFLVSVFIFTIMRIVPGDPALLILQGDEGIRVDPVELEELRKELGTDRPIIVQYGDWLWDLIRGDLGTSTYYGNPVAEDLKTRVPISLQLAFMGFAISMTLSVPLGVVSALKQESPIDYGARILTISGISIPYFLMAILILYGLARFFHWSPPLGYEALWDNPLKNLQQLILPAIALGVYDMAFVARITRSSMLEVLRQDYIRTARSKGLTESSVAYRHALKNALLPVITISGLNFANMFGATVITEFVFTVPGLGSLLLDSIQRRDLPVIQSVFILMAVMVLLINMLVDLLYSWLDPRVRYA